MIEECDQSAAQRERARMWLWRVLMLIAAGGFLGALSMALLARLDRLPPAPLTATPCIDEKLAFSRSSEFSKATLLAVGSSATWRNLDMERLEKIHPGVKAFNAATCYLHIDQTAFLTRHVLNHAPNATDVLTVVAPRDFENCNPRDTQIADPFLLDEYLSGTVPGWFIHLANFRLTYIVTQAFKIKDERQHLLRNDRYGSSPLYNRMSWNPAPVLDKRCFAALANFRQELSGRGIRLVVATVPVMPSWRAQFDPDGRMLSQWIDEIRASLGGNALLIDGRGLSLPDERFADPVHLLWPEGADYSDFIAGMLKIGS